MKVFTIFEALQEIKTNLPINIDILVSIKYKNIYSNKYEFYLRFNDNSVYSVDLDCLTFTKVQ
jgi:hypothetical protein